MLMSAGKHKGFGGSDIFLPVKSVSQIGYLHLNDCIFKIGKFTP
jgi:hypothetical protein